MTLQRLTGSESIPMRETKTFYSEDGLKVITEELNGEGQVEFKAIQIKAPDLPEHKGEIEHYERGKLVKSYAYEIKKDDYGNFLTVSTKGKYKTEDKLERYEYEYDSFNNWTLQEYYIDTLFMWKKERIFTYY